MVISRMGGTLVCFLAALPAAWAAEIPAPASPGSAVGTTIADRCPTFSWSRADGASSYELAVYRVRDEPVEEASLELSFEGSATSWTPALDRCLERNGRYGWTVRALGTAGRSPWSQPLLFNVAAVPSAEEVEAAMATVEIYLRSIGGEAPRAAVAAPADVPPASTAAAPPSGLDLLEPALQVDGEVRTVDSGGLPKSWGKGRPGTEDVWGLLFGPCSNGNIRFGLSQVAVDWGSAAEACPAGTWVCRRNEVVACNTGRPDSDFDGMSCDGSGNDYPSDAHRGWLSRGTLSLSTAAFKEDGGDFIIGTCGTLPTWCCWEVAP